MFSRGRKIQALCELPLPSSLLEQSRPPPQAAPVHPASLGTAKMMDTVPAHRPSQGFSNPAQPGSQINHRGMEITAFINIDPVFGEVHYFGEGDFSK